MKRKNLVLMLKYSMCGRKFELVTERKVHEMTCLICKDEYAKYKNESNG